MGLFDFIKGVAKKPIFISFGGIPWGNTTAVKKEGLYFGIAFACIDAIASAVSSVEYGLYSDDKNGEPVPVKGVSEAEKLLEKPNDFMTGADLLYITSAHIDTHGTSYWYLVKDKGASKPKEIWPLDPAKVAVVKGDNLITGYKYTNPKGEAIPFEIDEIIAIKRPHPFNYYEGVSTIEMARLAIENDLRATQWNIKFYENGAMPSGVLSTEQNIDKDTFKLLKDEWHKNYDGVKNAHKTAVLMGGLTYNPITLKQRDMDYLNGRKFSRDEILSIFGVPKAIVAITDDVNRANAETSDYVFAKRKVDPRLNLIFEKINRYYLPLFDKSGKQYFSYEDVVPENQDYELRKKVASVNSWRPVNEVRAEDHLEPIEGGDVLYIPSSLVPLGADMTPVTDPNAAPVDPAKKAKMAIVMKKFTKSDRKLLMKRNRYLSVAEKAFHEKLKAHWKFLIRLIHRGTENKSKAITKGMSVSEVYSQLVPDLTDWTKLLVNISFDFGLDSLKTGVKDTSDAYDLPTDNWNLESSGAIQLLQSEVNHVGHDASENIQDRIRQIIAGQLSEEETSLDDILSAIEDTLDEETDYRTDRIARTELINAYSEGSMAEYKNSGVVDMVKWMTSDDDACPICEANEEQGSISVSEDFDSGDGEPPAHPNCRCCIVPVFD